MLSYGEKRKGGEKPCGSGEGHAFTTLLCCGVLLYAEKREKRERRERKRENCTCTHIDSQGLTGVY